MTLEFNRGGFLKLHGPCPHVLLTFWPAKV
jgi:hypothetical protein